MGLFGNLLWAVGLICAVWVIYDVFTNNKKLSVEKKVIWTVFAILFSVITAIVYYFVYRK